LHPNGFRMATDRGSCCVAIDLAVYQRRGRTVCLDRVVDLVGLQPVVELAEHAIVEVAQRSGVAVAVVAPYQVVSAGGSLAVFADLAAAVADGADCVEGVAQLWADREHVFGPVASTATLWRLCDKRGCTASPRHEAASRSARSTHRSAAGLRSGWAKARSSCPMRSVVVAGGEGLLDKWKVLLSPGRARNLLGHLQASIRRRGEELAQSGLIHRR
jgi:hypothetical protein